MFLTSWTDIVANSLANLWLGVSSFIPNFLGALVILIIGLIIASALGKIVEKILVAVKLDSFLANLGLDEYAKRAGMHLHVARLSGQIVKWFFIIVFALAASDILGLYALTSFLSDVLAYVPNVIVAAIIMVASLAIANVLRNVVKASIKSAKLHGANMLGTLTWWAVALFGFFAALTQLNVAAGIIQILVTGVIAMFALAGGLAFGLGGQEHAKKFLEKMANQVRHHRHD